MILLQLLLREMEEAGQDMAKAPLPVVNKGIEDAGFIVEGDDIVVGNCCRYQSAVALR